MKKWSYPMQVIIGIIIAVIFAALFYGAIRWRNHVIREELANFQEKDDSYTFVYEERSWGPEVTKLILNTGNATEAFTEKDLADLDFSVSVHSEFELNGNEEERNAQREVTSSYFCDIDGNKVEKEEADHLLLELKTEGYSEDFSPFITNDDGTSAWKKIYTYSIKHAKFNSNIINCNSPLITEDARKAMEKLSLPQD